MSASPLYLSIDLDKPGKRMGFIGVPYSHNLGGWANLMMPIAVIVNGKGPTALVMAGNHGDEYPGPIAILKLMRELQA
ncbi:MAG: succinylglutamate desuccinylase/aspartoacylase family protein, partial [Gemmataceae bacterium]